MHPLLESFAADQLIEGSVIVETEDFTEESSSSNR